jgi:mono/diheme cytochrome c family protein
MTRSLRRPLAALALVPVALALAACGEKGIQLSSSDPNFRGASIFQQRCAGCHTIDAAGTQGSATNVRTRERKDGPNFNQRKENVQDVLYAIRNGGYSSGPMPQDIVTGQEAEQVAKFVAANSGKTGRAVQPTQPPPAGADSGSSP